MAGTVADHYAGHLGPVYTWMVGDLDAAFARSEAELEALPLPRDGGGIALDLGAGFGLHAIPLARRGFSVVAIDSCELLLQELAAHGAGLPIRIVHADLAAFRTHVPRPVDVIVCMGDTLTHLVSYSMVESLLDDAAQCLVPGGVFAATFRDYVSSPLQGDARFIPVRADAERILTCFLEYADTVVNVHDLLHQRCDGAWRLQMSSYQKLRLSPAWVVERLSSRGLEAAQQLVAGGMIRVTARKPPGGHAGTLSV